MQNLSTPHTRPISAGSCALETFFDGLGTKSSQVQTLSARLARRLKRESRPVLRELGAPTEPLKDSQEFSEVPFDRFEVRRPDRWDIIGGLLGDYVERIKRQTGLDWV